MAAPILSFNSGVSTDEGVFICEDKGERGPIFYPAIYSDEPSYSTQNTYTFSSMNYVEAPKYYQGDSVKVAVIDSGLNYTHEDFIDSSSNQIIQGHSRTIDNTSGSWLYYQFSSGYQSKIVDTLGHGTNVASVIASQINNIGCAGIAPNVELYIYKVTNTSNGYEWTAINSALQYCIDEGIDVVNMSFQAYEHSVTYNGSTMGASTGCSSVMTSMISSCYSHGITLVAAAGNYNTSEPSYPASNNHVISVGSLAESSQTTKAGYSNTYGIDLVAPGTVYVADKGNSDSYKKTQGTSFSAPIVTAAIALYKQKYPSATPSEIETALYDSCDPIDGTPSWAGNGRLNIDRFLNLDSGKPTNIIINNEMEDDTLSLTVDQVVDLDITVNGYGTYSTDVTYELFEDNGTISIDSNGRITALAEGDEIVTVRSVEDATVTAVFYVSVTQGSASLNVSPLSVILNQGGTQQLTASTEPANTITYTSGNNNIATVSSSGLITAIGVGSTQITVTANGLTKYVSVTVNKSPLSSIAVSNQKTSYYTGDTFVKPTVTATYENGDTDVVTNSATFTGYSLNNTGNQTVTVSYTENGVTKTTTYSITVSTAPQTETLIITRESFSSSGGYAWYDWEEDEISGKGELYTTTTTSMQFNKSKGNKVAAIYNSTAIPGQITQISATSQQTTIRSWTAYVTSTACSGSGTTLTFGNNKTTVGTVSPAVGTSTSFGTSNAGYSYFCLQENDSSASYLSEIKITYIPVTVSSIAVKTAPTKTVYDSGDTFDPTGLVITATYSDASTKDIAYAGNELQFCFSPSLSTSLTTSDISVSITYKEKSTSQAITVNAAKELSSITISGQITSFVEGDTFAFGGVVTAHFSDSTSDTVTGNATFTGYDMTSTGNQTVTVSYTHKGTTKTTTYSLTINEGLLSSIAVANQTTTYVKNGAFSFDGVCTATFENGYQKVVTPTSVSSPDMSTGGNKTITVSYTYNGRTETTTYQITVNSYRTVMEEQESEDEVGSVTYTDAANTSAGVSVSTSGYTTIENNSLRLGSGSNTGTLTVSSTSYFNKVVVNAKYYSTDGSSLNIGEETVALTGSYDDYEVETNGNVKSVSISTLVSKKRAHISSVTLYMVSSEEVDIGQSEDCVGLETFINNYMHMDYTDNLGYCKDNSHHYYSTAKAAFNALNTHQRSLFTSNSAYSAEWARLNAWAGFNGESLNASNLLASNNQPVVYKNNNVAVVVFSVSAITCIALVYFLFKRKKEN